MRLASALDPRHLLRRRPGASCRLPLRLIAGPKEKRRRGRLPTPRWLVVADRPDPLLGPALLRTGLAPFNASGSSKPRRSDSNYVLRSAPRSGAGRPQVHSPRPMVAASSLSIGSGRVVVFVFGAHLTTSARFRVRARVPVSGRLSTATSWRGWPSSRGFPLRLRRRHFASWSSCSRQGIGPSSRSAYRPANTSRTQTGFPRSARTSNNRGGCPLYPGDDGAHPGWPRSPAPVRRFSTARPCTPPQPPSMRGSA